ncbi:hypothetical protein C8R44DRAFT_725434 [Mycena epipterygia]|nr:hypothetical protein C8R44DRAFT_725434 [Mycena epipterygia]
MDVAADFFQSKLATAEKSRSSHAIVPAEAEMGRDILGFQHQVPAHDLADIGPTLRFIQELIQETNQFRTDAPYLVLFDYLKASTRLDALPYQFHQTCDIISLPVAPLSPVATHELVFTIGDITSSHIAALNSTTDIHLVDNILATLISFWPPDESDRLAAIPHGIVKYFNQWIQTAHSDVSAESTVLVSGPAF